MKPQRKILNTLVATLGLTVTAANFSQAHAQQLGDVLGQINPDKLEIVNVPGKFAIKKSPLPDGCENMITLPRYPTIEQLECKLKHNSVGTTTRCGGPISPAICGKMNVLALKADLLKKDVADEATKRGICVVSTSMPEINYSAITSVCPVGCFEANTKILVTDADDQANEIEAQNVQKSDRLKGLDKESNLAAPSLVSQRLKKITAGPEELPLFRFHLDNGRTLAVTSYHGMVLSDGRVVHAKDVSVNDLFLSKDGNPVSVLDISRAPTELDVFNFELDVADPQEHIMVAEDVLVGDLFWQFPDSVESYAVPMR